jgi:phage gp29-like protein
MQHTNPRIGHILVNEGDETGYSYNEGALAQYYLQIGHDRDLGLLSQLTPLILAKKLAMGSWLDYIEKYGIPGVWITTDNMTQERANELLEMGLNMISNHVGVLRGNEKIELGELPKTDAHKTFQELISVINSEISKLILGQDATSDQKDVTGTYGSLKVMAEVSNDRHESDKVFAAAIINKELFPRLLGVSSYYGALAGKKLIWDESQDMDNSTLIDKVVALTNVGYIIDFADISTRTGVPITGFNSKKEEVAEDPPNGKKVK